ncbi:MAG: hypothetical protein PW788_12790 [Micavibrio sp.]|nr:hypothetical protein [Micavibrio sp.]
MDYRPPVDESDLRRKFKSAALAFGLVMTPLSVVAQQAITPAPTTPPATTVVDSVPPAATPPETPVVALPHRFVPIASFAPLFSTADEKDRNIFFTQSKDAIREFHTLTNNPFARDVLTKADVQLLAQIRAEAKADVKKYKIPLPVAATLRLAARQTGTDFDAMLTRLQDNSGNVMNVNPQRLLASNVYKFNVSSWLYLMKQFGPQHGMGFFADKITIDTAVTNADGTKVTNVHVDDPAMLRQIVAMRENPRISLLIGAEYVKNETTVPQTAYKGMNYVYDAAVAERQRNLLTIGFDLGIRGADGIRGPLTAAAIGEFKLMSQPLLAQPGQTLDLVLAQAAQQAVADVQQYSARYPNLTPATTFAVRHAATVAGADFGYMMQLASAESGFDTGISATTSSATGLFQFIDNTWLTTLYQFGEKYGLGDITRNIEVERNRYGEIATASITDPLIEKYVLGLRTDPRVTALMGAEFAKANRDGLQAALPKRDITRTDQYLAHFLGSGKAVDFIVKLNREPKASASAAFPAAAESNHGVFYKRGGVARSLTEVYDFFKAKFSSSFFDSEPQTRQPRNVPLPQPRPPGL